MPLRISTEFVDHYRPLQAEGKKVGGRSKNQATREKVARYTDKNLGAEEVAKLADCSVATVYRIKNEILSGQLSCA